RGQRVGEAAAIGEVRLLSLRGRGHLVGRRGGQPTREHGRVRVGVAQEEVEGHGSTLSLAGDRGTALTAVPALAVLVATVGLSPALAEVRLAQVRREALGGRAAEGLLERLAREGPHACGLVGGGRDDALSIRAPRGPEDRLRVPRELGDRLPVV